MNKIPHQMVFEVAPGTKPYVFQRADEIGANLVKFAQRSERRDDSKEVLSFEKDSERPGAWRLFRRDVLPLDHRVDEQLWESCS